MQGGYIYVCLEGDYVKAIDTLKGNSVATIPIQGNSVRFNPAMVAQRFLTVTDSDNDGLPDMIEPQFSDINGNTFSGNPNKPDTDGDCLFDGVEAGTHMENYVLLNDVATYNVYSNPREPDTDYDGVPDFNEKELGTCPRNPDTDDDWLTDSVELLIDSDPLATDTDGDEIYPEYGSHADYLELIGRPDYYPEISSLLEKDLHGIIVEIKPHVNDLELVLVPDHYLYDNLGYDILMSKVYRQDFSTNSVFI